MQQAVAPAQPVAPVANPQPDGFATCSNAGVDEDGDGYGWENNQTCIVTNNTAQAPAPTAPAETAQPVAVAPAQQVAPINNPSVGFPVCSTASVDDDGDGYGWENNQTCVVTTDAAPIPGVTAQPVAPVQQVAPANNPQAGFPVCSTAGADEDGDGYGWENNQTCLVSNPG